MATIVVHGGAASIAPADLSAHEDACRRAAVEGLAVLRAGGSALDAAVAAVVVLEDSPVLNAGTGAVLNRDGEVELDALCMEGGRLGLGAVAAVRDLRNPIRVARRLVDVPDLNLLCGEGASRWAEANGFSRVSPDTLVTRAARARFEAARSAAPVADTVGAVATDDRGGTAAAVSTGGIPLKAPGRIGDTPLPGSGGWADDEVGAAVSTGIGEAIMRVLLAREAVEALRRVGDPVRAAREAIAHLAARTGGRAGVILVARDGRPGWAFNTEAMSHAAASTAWPEIRVGH